MSNNAYCADCGLKQHVNRKEWDRAAQPRCVACGGQLEPSKTLKEKMIDARIAAEDRSDYTQRHMGVKGRKKQNKVKPGEIGAPRTDVIYELGLAKGERPKKPKKGKFNK